MTMIEKMARALFEVSHDPEHSDDWETLSEPWKDNFREHAAAVLVPLLTPTPEMLRATDGEDADVMVARGRAYISFQLMIQSVIDQRPKWSLDKAV